jgi:CheY-like chemotaxis protein
MPRILLVDDSSLVRNSMQAALEPYGVELGHAENGEIAVAKACSSRWDLIFLDVVMPVMDGPTALKQIRASGVTTPVVLVTSVSIASVVAAAVKLGGVEYIGKPFTPDLVRSVAQKLLKLDPSALHSPPRVLLQGVTTDMVKQVARLLPPHIVIDHAASLGEAIDLAESHGHGLAIFETPNAADEGPAIASVLRAALPAAGIFALGDSGTAEPWAPVGALDGVLPRPIPPALGRGFLYANFLRPLIFVDGRVARAAGFVGPAVHLPAYLAMVERTLRGHCARLDLAMELQIDLRDLQADADTVVAFVHRVNGELREAGAAPGFRIAESVAGSTAAQLVGVLML